MQKVSGNTRVNEILIEYPELTDYLMEIGLCRTDSGPECRLAWELSKAAAEAGVDIHWLIQDLNQKINELW